MTIKLSDGRVAFSRSLTSDQEEPVSGEIILDVKNNSKTFIRGISGAVERVSPKQELNIETITGVLDQAGYEGLNFEFELVIFDEDGINSAIEDIAINVYSINDKLCMTNRLSDGAVTLDSGGGSVSSFIRPPLESFKLEVVIEKPNKTISIAVEDGKVFTLPVFKPTYGGIVSLAEASGVRNGFYGLQYCYGTERFFEIYGRDIVTFKIIDGVRVDYQFIDCDMFSASYFNGLVNVYWSEPYQVWLLVAISSDDVDTYASMRIILIDPSDWSFAQISAASLQESYRDLNSIATAYKPELGEIWFRGTNSNYDYAVKFPIDLEGRTYTATSRTTSYKIKPAVQNNIHFTNTKPLNLDLDIRINTHVNINRFVWLQDNINNPLVIETPGIPLGVYRLATSISYMYFNTTTLSLHIPNVKAYPAIIRKDGVDRAADTAIDEVQLMAADYYNRCMSGFAKIGYSDSSPHYLALWYIENDYVVFEPYDWFGSGSDRMFAVNGTYILPGSREDIYMFSL